MDYKVAVICQTYNHAQFICDALDGFSMQKTDFPYFCGIIDDASKDGTPSILEEYSSRELDMDNNGLIVDKEYGKLIFAQHKTNHNCHFVIILLNENHHSQKKRKLVYLSEWLDDVEYEAICEGDDYWISSDKLQRQVEFMDTHPDYSMCFHEDKTVKDGLLLQQRQRYCVDCDVPVSDIVTQGGLFVPTASILFRKKLRPFPPVVYQQHVLDYPMQIYLSSIGKVRYMHTAMSVYRFGSEGSWTGAYDEADDDQKRKTFELEQKLLTDMNSLTAYKYDKYFRRRSHLNKFLFFKKSNVPKAAWHLVQIPSLWDNFDFNLMSSIKNKLLSTLHEPGYKGRI